MKEETKVEEAPGEEKQRKGVGQQMFPPAVYQRMCEDAEHASLLAGIDAEMGEIPVHPYFQKFEQIEHQQKEGRDGCSYVDTT